MSPFCDSTKSLFFVVAFGLTINTTFDIAADACNKAFDKPSNDFKSPKNSST